MNPLNLTGPTFLALYLGLFVLALLVRLLSTVAQSKILVDRPSDGPLPDAYDTAWLNGGDQALVSAAVVALHRLAKVEFKNGAISLVSDAERRIPSRDHIYHPLEQALLDALSRKSCISTEEAGTALAVERAKVVQKMQAGGYAYSSFGIKMSFFVVRIFLPLLIIAGAAKVYVGLTRDRPVFFLMLLLIISLLVVRFFWKQKWTSGKSTRYLHASSQANDALRLTACTAPSQLSPSEAVLAFALFGTAVVVPELGGLYAPPLIQAPLAAVGGHSCSVSSCGSSCGGSGCGGGCGGCGS